MSSLKSSVASGLRDLLEKWTISDNDLRNMLLRFVKNKHCGRAELARFRGSFFETGRSEVDSSLDVSVEAIVDDLLRLRTQKFHAERDELAGRVDDGITIEPNVQIITGMDKSAEKSVTKEEEICFAGKTNCNEEDTSTVSVRTSVQDKSSKDTVCIPMAVLNDLFRKIDNLTETVEKQNSTILDIEKRLKEEMKLREKRLLEQISCNFSEQTCTILDKQERKEKSKKSKKEKRSERADTTVVVQTSEQSVYTGSEHERSYAITKDIHGDGHDDIHGDGHDEVPQPQPRTSSYTPTTHSSEHTRKQAFEPMASDDDSWQLITTKKPGTKKSVLYVGNIRPDTTEDSLALFIQKRCDSLKICPPKVFNCRIFTKQSADNNAGARVTIPASAVSALTNRTFWPRPTYARQWKFQSLASGDQAAAEISVGEASD